MKSNHKYRVSVYLGKAMYEQLETMAKTFGVSIATMTKILLNTGWELGMALEEKEQKANGK